jgi:hypothetical protein
MFTAINPVPVPRYGCRPGYATLMNIELVSLKGIVLRDGLSTETIGV